MNRSEILRNITKNRLIIEVCGGIASGKTTFTLLMGDTNLNPVLEDFKKSPFWKDFYCNPGKYIFETEVSFILLHYHQIKKTLDSTKNDKIICDFSFLLDLAYAKIGLTGRQLKAFECVLDEIRKGLPKTNLIVYLKCDPKTELERIRRRARAEENSINLEFLNSLDKALRQEVNKIQGILPIITIDSAKKDFANVELVREEMISLINDFLSKSPESITSKF